MSVVQQQTIQELIEGDPNLKSLDEQLNSAQEVLFINVSDMGVMEDEIMRNVVNIRSLINERARRITRIVDTSLGNIR